MFKRVLVATDLQRQSLVALRMASALSHAHRAGLVALHVIPMPAELRRWGDTLFRTELAAYKQIVDRQAASARIDLEAQMSRLARRARRPLHCLVRVGSPADVIVATADEVGADLIIMARGRGGILGPNTERLVRMAGRAVLVAPVRLPPGVASSERLAPPRKRPGRTPAPRA